MTDEFDLTTERLEAVERAREVLASRVGPTETALDASLESLWNMLSPIK